MNGVGIPCLTCGGTRCVRALADFSFLEAFWANPLIFFGVTVLVVGWLYCLTLKIFQLPRMRLYWINQRLGNIIRIVALSAVALNWAYLIFYAL
ncbi:MAG: DUF2752 domain-containing protein [Chthoniobacterales bacterium]